MRPAVFLAAVWLPFAHGSAAVAQDGSAAIVRDVRACDIEASAEESRCRSLGLAASPSKGCLRVHGIVRNTSDREISEISVSVLRRGTGETVAVVPARPIVSAVRPRSLGAFSGAVTLPRDEALRLQQDTRSKYECAISY